VVDQILALLKEDGLILSPKMDIAISRLQTQFTIVTVRGDTLLAKRPKDTTAFDGREICIVVRSSACCSLNIRILTILTGLQAVARFTRTGNIFQELSAPKCRRI